MNTARREELARILHDRQRSAEDAHRSHLAALDEIGRARGSENADDEHDPEGVTLADEWSRLAALRDQSERDLAAIDAALVRLDDGDYGTCETCGKPIPLDRLRARPTATRCVPCASA